MNPYLRHQTELAYQSLIFDYRRLSFIENWEIKFPNAKKLMKNAAYIARVEGNINHALSLESRLSELPENSTYFCGRSKNGCSTGRFSLTNMGTKEKIKRGKGDKIICK
ncbi:MAG: hypothetical protein WCK29_01165 [archaeon]